MVSTRSKKLLSKSKSKSQSPSSRSLTALNKVNKNRNNATSPATKKGRGRSKSPATKTSRGRSKSPATKTSRGRSKSPATKTSRGRSKSRNRSISRSAVSKSPATSLASSKSPIAKRGRSRSPAIKSAKTPAKSPRVRPSKSAIKSAARGRSKTPSKSPNFTATRTKASKTKSSSAKTTTKKSTRKSFSYSDSDTEEVIIVSKSKSRSNKLSMENLDDGIENISNDSLLLNPDRYNIALLILLYALQGIPLGLVMGSLPFLIQAELSKTNTAVYSLLSFFSLTSYPYSLKLLWSPFVDTYYISSLGRRKSWVIPAQFLIATFMFIIAQFISVWMETANITTMTIIFFILILLVATQDIAVDGWAITILSSDNQAYASTCQAIGLNIGYFTSYTIFLALQSTEFSNKAREFFTFDKQDFSLLSLPTFIQFVGFLYIFVTFLLFVVNEDGWRASSNSNSSTELKSRKSTNHEAFESEKLIPPPNFPMDNLANHSNEGLWDVYKQIYYLLTLPSNAFLIFYLITSKIGFAANDNVTVLKLLEKGFPREYMGMLALIGFPLEMVAPILVARWVKRTTELTPLIFAFPIRLFMCFASSFVVYFLPKSLDIWAYLVIIIFQLSYELICNMMFCAFFVKISNPAIGATHMTLLNTLANLGGTWVKSLTLAAVEWFTFSEQDCTSGECKTVKVLDGYYPLVLICFILGSVYFWLIRPRLIAIDNSSATTFHYKKVENDEK